MKSLQHKNNIMVRGALFVVLLLFGIVSCSTLKDTLVSKTKIAIPPYPSLVSYCDQLEQTLLSYAGKGYLNYKLFFGMEWRWSNAPAGLNDEIDKWNSQRPNTAYAKKRFNTAVDELQEHWNHQHPDVPMKLVKEYEYEFVWM